MKGKNQKIKLLLLKKILEEYTDEDHDITIDDMRRHLKTYDVDAERKSLYEDIEALNQLQNEFDIEIEHPKGSKTYRLISRPFDLFELKLMIDSIQSSKFLSEAKSLALIKKLGGLCSTYQRQALQRQVIVSNRVKTMNTSIHYNVDGLHAAITANRQVQYRYFDFDIKKQRKYFKKGEKYTVSPWRLIYTDDNYYLLAYDEEAKKFKHFRVDKMDSVLAIGEDRIGKEEFDKLDMAAYTKYTFSMFGGEVQDVAMVFQNRMMGAVIDRFGRDVWPQKVDDRHFQVTVPVAVSNQFFGWVFGLGNMVRIVSPESVKQHLKTLLYELEKRYE